MSLTDAHCVSEIDEGRTHNVTSRTSPGWKLFFLLSRLLLHRPPRGHRIPKVKLQAPH